MRRPEMTIVTCAVGGSVHTPSMSPYQPVTPDEIARAAIDAVEAGASTIAKRRIGACEARSLARAEPYVRPCAALQDIFTVWRTDADQRCCDPSLDPSERGYSSCGVRKQAVREQWEQLSGARP